VCVVPELQNGRPWEPYLRTVGNASLTLVSLWVRPSMTGDQMPSQAIVELSNSAFGATKPL
jgi:hypothetical protein